MSLYTVHNMYLPKYCPSGPHPDILLLRLEFSLTGDDDTIFKNSEIKNTRGINTMYTRLCSQKECCQGYSCL